MTLGDPSLCAQIWTHKRSQVDFPKLPPTTITNYFQRFTDPSEPLFGHITSKVGLCSTLNAANVGWAGGEIANPSDFFPRNYNLMECDGMEQFEIDFKRTAAEAVLKRAVADGSPFFNCSCSSDDAGKRVDESMLAVKASLEVLRTQEASAAHLAQDDDEELREDAGLPPSLPALDAREWDAVLHCRCFDLRPET
eukprot:gene16551-19659_t